MQRPAQGLVLASARPPLLHCLWYCAFTHGNWHAMKWKVCSPGKTYEAGEGRGVYFDAGSGDTHLVDHTTLAVLRILAPAPLSLEEIAAQLAATGPDTDLECSQLEDVLHELATVDLVEIV